MKKLQPFLTYALIFILSLLFFQNIQGARKEIIPEGQITVTALKDSAATGKELKFKISNGTSQTLELKNPCPDPFLQVYRLKNGQPEELKNDLVLTCTNAKNLSIEPGKTAQVSLGDYSYEMFSEIGQYQVGLTLPDGKVTLSSVFEVHAPSFLTKMWRTLLYIPFLNALVGMIVLLPNHSLGIAVILITVLIRTLLLIPSNRAMRAQQAMQRVQPELEILKKKYANDQARLAQETMLVWQKHKVHPLSSCLPLFIQIPILIALFNSFRTGLHPDRQQLLYPFLSDFSLSSVNTHFLGMDLLQRNVIILPIIVAALQFIQMQMMTQKTAPKTDMPDEMAQANSMMKYTMPVMIGVFTAQVPAAIGIYWGASTFYGIIQQAMVNKTATIVNDPEEVSIKVISKNHGKSH